jgi:aspartyl-tRNA(Asn)/glutamyl-tRNA(Gln) amidotransferase subunit B
MSRDAAPAGGPSRAGDFEAVLGLEVHVQLRTRSKAFCACPTRYGEAPNTSTCPACAGLPGALPVLNDRAVELALRLALAAGCTVRPESVFSRKNYFYADLPKGYQITQHDRPLAEGGALTFDVGDEARSVALTRIHLEEDAGKSMHEASESSSFVDFNRSGVPLAEVVTAPDFRSTDEVHACLVALRRLVRYLGVSDGNMEEGSLRCDCNVSLRPRGSAAFGTRVELKNLNSFRSVVRAAEAEIARQAAILSSGGRVQQGTRLWDEARGETQAMRVKEEAHDYRYFPEPDLLPLAISAERIERVRAGLPELPAARRARFVAALGLTPYDAGVLTSSKAVADFYEETARHAGDPKAASNWVQGEVLRELKERHADLEDEELRFPVTPARLAALSGLVASGELSVSAAKRVFAEMAWRDADPAPIVEALGLRQVTDETALREAVRGALRDNAQAVADWRAGNARTFGFLVGQAMKATRGQGAPARVNEILREELNGVS